MATCKGCGTEFTPKNKNQIFCNGQCKARYYWINLEEATTICEGCGKEFKYKVVKNHKKPRFCSASCGSLSWGTKTKHLKCVDCGAEFEFRGRTKKLRCDSCVKKHRSKLVMKYRAAKDPSVRVGIGSGGGQSIRIGEMPYPDSDKVRTRLRANYAKKRRTRPDGWMSRKLRLELINRYKCCDICGYNTDIRALILHHKDMDRWHNEEDNLKVICSNCHAIIHKEIAERWKNLSNEDRPQVPLDVYSDMWLKAKQLAEIKGRNEAGKPDRATRTEGCEESQSGATHSSTSRTDMSCHEAVPMEQGNLFD